MNNINKKYMKVALPFLVLIVFIILAKIVTSNPPETRRSKPSKAPQLNVDVLTLKNKDYQVVIDSYGTVKPRTQSVLYPQVSGQIIEIATKFRAGGFFERGDVLVKLDDRDLKAEVKIAQSNLFNAQQAYSEEQARVEQAKQDWERLGSDEQASDLVLRKPQMLAAEAKVYSAQASLDKAKLGLERTHIIAPYSGRILAKNVDIGQLVSPNTKLAEIYAIDYVEIRLPLKNKDLPFVDLPENTRFSQDIASELPSVIFQSNLVKGQSWEGSVVRTEGAYDQNSQQLFVVGQIDDPYGDKTQQGMPIKIGQYVSAKIHGKTVSGVLTIPNKAIYQGSYVYIVEDGLLKRQNITLAWQNDKVAIVDQGITEDQLLVLTPLGQVTSGTPIAINRQDGEQSNEISAERKPRKNKPQRSGKRDGKGDKGARS